MSAAPGHAIIIGAGSGVSGSLARALHARGWRVALIARDVAKLGALTAATDALAYSADASSPSDIDRVFAEIDAEFGSLDLAVYNAGLRGRNTIQGSGIIGDNGLTLLNQAGGIVIANGTPTSVLEFVGGAVTNQGLMEATGSGVLQVDADTINNAGGVIKANGGTVQFFGSATIEGGTLTNNGGAMETPSGFAAILDGTTQGALTINGTYLSDLNSQTTLLGTINNHNNFQLNGGSGTNSILWISTGNVTLQGGGTLTLSTAGGGGNAFIDQTVGGLTLENVNNTIEGNGIIGNNGLSVLNDAAGTLLANVSGGTLLFNSSGTLTNNGTMEATSGARCK